MIVFTVTMVKYVYFSVHRLSWTWQGTVKFEWTILQCPVAVHLLQFELIWLPESLALDHRFFSSKHLTDLHEGLVFCLRNCKKHIESYSEAHTAEHQVAVRSCQHLKNKKTSLKLDQDTWSKAAGDLWLKNWACQRKVDDSSVLGAVARAAQHTVHIYLLQQPTVNLNVYVTVRIGLRRGLINYLLLLLINKLVDISLKYE